MKKFLSIFPILLFCSCNYTVKKVPEKFSDLPIWYVSVTPNDGQNLYGVGEGYTLEEATKAALAYAAARIIVSVSSQSSLLREENNSSTNEEMRQKINQNIEKIDFVNFVVTKSVDYKTKIYAEIAIDREQFIRAQREKSEYLDQKIANLQKNIPSQNLIQKRNSLIELVDLLKQGELLARILQAAGEDSDVKKKLSMLADTQNQLAKLNDKVEFYFEFGINQEIATIISNALNKERISVVKTKTNASNQVAVEVSSSKKSSEIYGAYITKIKLNFENKSAGKIIASNSIEVSGSSTISEKESYAASLEVFKEKVTNDGILKILGII